MTTSIKQKAVDETPLDDKFASTEYLSDYAQAIAQIAYYKARTEILKRDMMLMIGQKQKENFYSISDSYEYLKSLEEELVHCPKQFC